MFATPPWFFFLSLFGVNHLILSVLHQTSEQQRLLQRRQAHYHSFNITQQLLQHVLQVTVRFRRPPPPTRAFPIMLLFRYADSGVFQPGGVGWGWGELKH